jgi:hypothetical protein
MYQLLTIKPMQQIQKRLFVVENRRLRFLRLSQRSSTLT